MVCPSQKSIEVEVRKPLEVPIDALRASLRVLDIYNSDLAENSSNYSFSKMFSPQSLGRWQLQQLTRGPLDILKPVEISSMT
jgi:hypothetical protein